MPEPVKIFEAGKYYKAIRSGCRSGWFPAYATYGMEYMFNSIVYCPYKPRKVSVFEEGDGEYAGKPCNQITLIPIELKNVRHGQDRWLSGMFNWYVAPSDFIEVDKNGNPV